MYLPASKLTSTQLRPDEAMIVLSEGYRADPVRAKSRSAFSMAHMSWRLLVKMGDSRCMFYKTEKRRAMSRVASLEKVVFGKLLYP